MSEASQMAGPHLEVTQHNSSFVTDLPITAATAAELADCGRVRWKIENETFNVARTHETPGFDR